MKLLIQHPDGSTSELECIGYNIIQPALSDKAREAGWEYCLTSGGLPPGEHRGMRTGRTTIFIRQGDSDWIEAQGYSVGEVLYLLDRVAKQGETIEDLRR